jgi:hypothetical protein
MTPDQSRKLKPGARVCFNGNPTDRGTVKATNAKYITIKWRDGHKSYTGHGDMGRVDSVASEAAKKELIPMFYKGIEFNIIQGIEPGVWKWSVSTDEGEAKSGQTKTKQAAVIAAWQAIDKALAPKNPDDAAIGKP